MFEKKLGHAFRFDSLPPSFQSVESEVSTSQGQQKVNYQLHSLPLYAIERLSTILDEIRNDGEVEQIEPLTNSYSGLH